MPGITQKKNFFKENYFYLFGFLWFFMGLMMWLLVKNAIYLTYFPLGIGTMLYGHFNKKRHSAYIKWDEKSITLKEWTEKSKTYKFRDIDQIIISKGHLTIKSGAANGIMVELKDYNEEDKHFLQQSIPSFPVAGRNIPETKQS